MLFVGACFGSVERVSKTDTGRRGAADVLCNVAVQIVENDHNSFGFSFESCVGGRCHCEGGSA